MQTRVMSSSLVVTHTGADCDEPLVPVSIPIQETVLGQVIVDAVPPPVMRILIADRVRHLAALC